jgi:hypothetical protein
VDILSRSERIRSMPDLNQLLYELCLEIAAVWQAPRLLDSPSTSLPKVVATRAEEGGPILPRTKRPIRGHNEVTVDVRESKLQGTKLAESLASQALLDPWGYRSDDPEIQKAREPLNAKIEEVFSLLKTMDYLPERLFEAVGFKHYEPEEVLQRAREEANSASDRKVIWKLQLASAIGRALAASRFDPAQKQEFGEWEAVADLVAQDFKSLAVRRRNHYQAVIFLNSPLLDQEGSTAIAHLKIGEEPIEVCISAATDEFLSERRTSEIPVDQVNTIISFDFTVDVEAPVETYLGWYPSAVFLAQRITDVLRLICTDDVGVLALEIFEPDWATPSIRKTYESSYRIDLAPYQPKRFRFSPH